jgi:hypothetical protein
VRHVGVHRIVLDDVNAGLRHDLARLVFLRHAVLQGKVIDDPSTPRSA